MDISISAFEQAIPPSELRTMQIIQGFLGMFVLCLAGVLLLIFLVSQGDPAATPPASTIQLINLLSLIHVILALGLFIAAHFVYKAQFDPARLARQFASGLPDQQGQLTHDPALCSLIIIRTAMILRSAMYDGIALYGLVVSLLAIVLDSVVTQPLYWLNMASSVLFVGYILFTFPTTGRIKQIFATRIAPSRHLSSG